MAKNFDFISEENYKELVSEHAYEYLTENRPDDVLYSMDEFDELMNPQVESEGALWLAQRIHFGDFNPNHDYFYFNGYANLCSTDWADEYYDKHLDRDEFLEWCDGESYLDDYKEDEEDEDEDESEEEE